MTVSIHARAERATLPLLGGNSEIPSFNPRTRRACDLEKLNPQSQKGVSIHARAERATLKDFWGYTPGCMFQSTHAQSVRRGFGIFRLRRKNVSIHARAERATVVELSSDCFFLMFQSTHAQSVRLAFLLPLVSPKWFQSTHAQSVRLATL